MKKLYVAILLLLISFFYVINKVTEDLLYLPDFSSRVDNPVNLTLNTISIDTRFIEPATEGNIYHIWMTPVYILVFTAIILTLMTIFKRKTKG